MSAAIETKTSMRMTAEERRLLARDGYVLRNNVYSQRECEEIADVCEKLVTDLSALKSKRGKITYGSYMFESHDEFEATVKWEPFAPDLVQGLEPFAHLSPKMTEWALEPRLVDPCKDICGSDEVVLFTEKLNLKRAKKGGPIVLHQDYPYWESWAEVAARVATAMVFLDDSTIENGCLEVAPGSHTVGKHKQRIASDGFGSLEMDQSVFDMKRLIPLEVKAGAVVFFGAFLVHQSLPNKSDKDRRALLYSYQPAGYPHSREYFRPKKGETAQA
jgi:ectoine hydroxylase